MSQNKSTTKKEPLIPPINDSFVEIFNLYDVCLKNYYTS